MTTAPTETVLVSTLEAELLSSFLVSVPPPQAHSANTMTRASASATILLNFIVVSLLFNFPLKKIQYVFIIPVSGANIKPKMKLSIRFCAKTFTH